MGAATRRAASKRRTKGYLPGFFPWLILVPLSLIMYGTYFAYDAVGALGTQITDGLGLTSTQFTRLYAIYSLPNMVMPFFGGLFIDRVGASAGGLVFCALVVLGSVVVAFAPTVGSYNLMLVGRLIFGLGAESLSVSQNAFISKWFAHNGQLATGFAIAVTVSRLGTLFTFSAESYIAKATGSYVQALYFASLICVASFVCLIGATVMDWLATPAFERQFGPDVNTAPAAVNDDAEGSQVAGDEDLEDAAAFDFRAVRQFKAPFWMIAAVCTFFYASVVPFSAISPQLFAQKYGYAPERAGLTTSIYIATTIVLSPILGKVVDRVGKRPLLILIGSLLLVPCHAALAFTTIPPEIPMVGLGVAFSLVPAALWPSIPLFIKHSGFNELVGMAFGITLAMQNTGLVVSNLMSGHLITAYGGQYHMAVVYFTLLDVVSVGVALALVVADRRNGGFLALGRETAEVAIDVAASTVASRSDVASIRDLDESSGLLNPHHAPGAVPFAFHRHVKTASTAQSRHRYLGRLGVAAAPGAVPAAAAHFGSGRRRGARRASKSFE